MEPKEIPTGVSPVRHIMSEIHGNDFQPLFDFDRAKADPDGVVVFEADYGGQIMMTIRMKYVKCSERQLDLLLFDLHRIAWEGHDERGGSLYYERIPVGGGVAGGMGGGCVVDGVWAHPRFEKDGIVDMGILGTSVGDVLEGRSERLPEILHKKRDSKQR